MTKNIPEQKPFIRSSGYVKEKLLGNLDDRLAIYPWSPFGSVGMHLMDIFDVSCNMAEGIDGNYSIGGYNRLMETFAEKLPTINDYQTKIFSRLREISNNQVGMASNATLEDYLESLRISHKTPRLVPPYACYIPLSNLAIVAPGKKEILIESLDAEVLTENPIRDLLKSNRIQYNKLSESLIWINKDTYIRMESDADICIDPEFRVDRIRIRDGKLLQNLFYGDINLPINKNGERQYGKHGDLKLSFEMPTIDAFKKTKDKYAYITRVHASNNHLDISEDMHWRNMYMILPSVEASKHFIRVRNIFNEEYLKLID